MVSPVARSPVKSKTSGGPPEAKRGGKISRRATQNHPVRLDSRPEAAWAFFPLGQAIWWRCLVGAAGVGGIWAGTAGLAISVLLNINYLALGCAAERDEAVCQSRQSLF